MGWEGTDGMGAKGPEAVDRTKTEDSDENSQKQQMEPRWEQPEGLQREPVVELLMMTARGPENWL